jgi:hypothetical protein
MLRRIWVLAALIVLAAAPTALAAPVNVNLRVEGSSETLFDGPLTTDGHDVTTVSGGTHKCDGTNGAKNPAAGPSMTAALDDGAKVAGFDFDGTYDSGFDDFFLSRIGPDTNTGAPTFEPYWAFVLNWVPTNLGGCQQRINAGDQVQFLYMSFGQPMLELTGVPAKAAVGESFTAKVFDHDGNGNTVPGAGASVAGQVTGADGAASVHFDSPGVQRLKATRAGAVRSNAAEVCVYSPGSGACDTFVPSTSQTTAHDSTDPVARIASPRDGKRYSRGPRVLRGAASDNVALYQVYFRLRRYAGRDCSWYSAKSERFTGKDNCEHARFQKVGKDAKWSYLLPERLKPGRYVLEQKSIDTSYNEARQRVSFRVLG